MSGVCSYRVGTDGEQHNVMPGCQQEQRHSFTPGAPLQCDSMVEEEVDTHTHTPVPKISYQLTAMQLEPHHQINVATCQMLTIFIDF